MALFYNRQMELLAVCRGVSSVSVMIYYIFLCTLLSPTFGAVDLRYTVTEEQDGTVLLGNLIQDSGLDLESGFQFQYLPQSSVNRFLFRIDNVSGDIKTTRKIDRESVCPSENVCTVDIQLSVTENNDVEVVNIVIEIIDINDNSPNFKEKSVNIIIPEGTSLDTKKNLPSAEDFDGGINGVQDYKLQDPSGKFQLDVSIPDVNLVLKGELDYEDQAFYQMVLTALDGDQPPKSGTMLINVTVSDMNDHKPVFQNTSYEISIQENTDPPTTILQVFATDEDSGRNGEIIYSFEPQTKTEYGDIFGIRGNSGEIYVKGTVDFESNLKSYTLRVMAEDQGQNSQPVYARVVIHVRDVNDNSPDVSVSTLTDTPYAQVSENATVGTFVAHLSVKDIDSGDNGKFDCVITDNQFELQKQSDSIFYIITKATFNREVTAEYLVTVTCTDKGAEPMTSSSLIRVQITDENDHYPLFTKDVYRLTVEENNMVGVSLLQVKAEDKDIGENARITYHLLPKDKPHVVSIDGDTGVITAKIQFDHEKKTLHEFRVVAKDQGETPRSATALVSIKITDVNDVPPTFNQGSYSFQLQENLAENTVVGKLAAIDLDSYPYNDIKYSIRPDSKDSTQFTINTTSAEIRTHFIGDRERQGSYRIVVLAKNEDYPNMMNAVNVSINILDVNDNAPIIIFPNKENNTVQVAPRAEVGQVISRIEAFDQDMGINAKLTFSIANGNSRDLFEIDKNTGALLVKKSLVDVGHSTMKLVIIVADSGQPKMQAITDLNVFVNKSLGTAASTGDGPFVKSQTFIIIIAIVSGIVLVFLFIVIGYVIVQWRRKQTDRQNKYNARIAEKDKQSQIGAEQTAPPSNGHIPNGTCKNGSINGILKKDSSGLKMSNGGEMMNGNHQGVWATDMNKQNGHNKFDTRRIPHQTHGRAPPGGGRITYDPSAMDQSTSLNEEDLEMQMALGLMQTKRDSVSGSCGSCTDSGKGGSEEEYNCMVTHRQSPVDSQPNYYHRRKSSLGRYPRRQGSYTDRKMYDHIRQDSIQEEETKFMKNNCEFPYANISGVELMRAPVTAQRQRRPGSWQGRAVTPELENQKRQSWSIPETQYKRNNYAHPRWGSDSGIEGLQRDAMLSRGDSNSNYAMQNNKELQQNFEQNHQAGNYGIVGSSPSYPAQTDPDYAPPPRMFMPNKALGNVVEIPTLQEEDLESSNGEVVCI